MLAGAITKPTTAKNGESIATAKNNILKYKIYDCCNSYIYKHILLISAHTAPMPMLVHQRQLYR